MQALYNSLRAVESEYPLVVMCTPGVPAAEAAALAELGCTLLRVDPLALPTGSGDRVAAYMSPHFAKQATAQA